MKQHRSMDLAVVSALTAEAPESSSKLARQFRSCASRGARVPVFLGALTCVFLGAMTATSPSAIAGGGYDGNDLKDSDGDGLSDNLEYGLHTGIFEVDSDGDGWNDAEEVARGSLPLYAASIPDEQGLALGANAYVLDGKLRFCVATYARSGTLNNLSLKLALYGFNKHWPLAAKDYAHSMHVTTVPTKVAGQLIVITDIEVSASPLMRTGSMSIYATLSEGTFVACADAVNLLRRGATIVEMVPPTELSPSAGQQLGQGLLQRPLGGCQVPGAWTSGEICFQTLDSVGSHGSVVTQEVVASSCISGWDGYCDAGSCATSVGRTVDLVDPSALIGG